MTPRLSYSIFFRLFYPFCLFFFPVFNIHAQNVGIGTQTPEYKLTIAGEGPILGLDNNASIWARNTSGYYEPFLYPRDFNDATTLVYGPNGFNLSANGLVPFSIASNGAVNINNYGSTQLPFTIGGMGDVFGVDNSAVLLAKNSDGNYEPFFYPRWSDNRTILNYGTGGLQIRDMDFISRMIFTPSGTVGINTDYPDADAALHVTGAVHVDGAIKIADGSQANGKVLVSDDYGNASWQDAPSGVETDPKVGNLTTGTVPTWNGTTLSDGNITQVGNKIGIFTTNPSIGLHINGIVRITDGTQGSGKVLTSSSTGIASWQTFNETDPKVNTWGFNMVPKFDGNKLVDGIMTDNGSKIGIGTTNPIYLLTLGGSGTVLGIDNGTSFAAKNSGGVYDNFLWPRTSDNKTYLNYGSGGFEIRNNASSTKFMIDNLGNVGIGTTSPNASLHVAGNFILQNGLQGEGKVLKSTANGTGIWLPEDDPQVSVNVPNAVPRWNGSTLTPGAIYDDGVAHVGINTSNPTASLHVMGNVMIQDGSQADGKILSSDANGLATWKYESDPKIFSTSYGKVPRWNGVALEDGTIYNSGVNVGIGTSSPNYLLTLGGSGNVMGFDNDAAIMARNSANTYENFLIPRLADNSTWLFCGAGGFNLNDNMGNTRMKISSTGNIGIGTSSPTTKLQVNGSLRIVDGTEGAGKVLTSDANGVASWTNANTPNESDPQVSSVVPNQVPRWAGSTLVDGVITDNGLYVGVGITNPSDKLHIVGKIRIDDGSQANNRVLASDANGRGTWTNLSTLETDPKIGTLTTNKTPKWNGTNLIDGLLFDDGTNIGIGTTTPSAKLHVTGQVKIVDGNQSAGKVLTSDANGLASWSTLPVSVETDPKVGSLSSNKVAKWNGTTLADGLITDNGTNIGIGTTSPDTKLHVAGAIKIVDGTQSAGKVLTSDANGLASWATIPAPTETDPQVASTTSAQVPKWNGTALVDGVMTDNGTNVGIGTTSPSAKLHVNGSIKIVDGTQAAGKVLVSDANGLASWATSAETDPKVGTLTTNKMPKWNGTTLTDGVMAESSGNIGIGTTSPSQKLHVSSNGTSGYAGAIFLDAPNMVTGSATVMMLGKNSATRGEMRYQYAGTSAGNGFQFGFAGIQPFVCFNEDQEVGIGTLDPTAKLHVAGQVKIADGSQGLGRVLTSDINGLASWQNSLTLSNTGNVIQLENGATLLAKNSSGVYEPFLYPRWTDNRTILDFGTGGLEIRDNAFATKLRITPTGNVAIGNITPGGLFELAIDSGRKPATSTWTISSDARVKNIEGSYTKGMSEIMQLNPIRYHYINTREKTFSPEVLATENVGLTAQEVQKVFPEAVGVDPDGTLNLNIHPILIAEINAMQELQNQVTEQKNVIASQQEQINELSNKLEQLLNQLEVGKQKD